MRLARVAITGGVASGKSTLCRFLRDLGAYVVSADQIVHQLLLNDTSVQQSIVKLLGQEVFHQGQLSREKLAASVFKDRKKLEALEAILHPRVAEEIDRLFQHNSSSSTLLVAEVPLLFEAGLDKKFDVIVTVWSPNRLNEKEDFEDRAARQLTPKEKVIRSPFVVLNRGSLTDLRKEASLLYRRLVEFL
jgi:dephospho-CoA kinase